MSRMICEKQFTCLKTLLFYCGWWRTLVKEEVTLLHTWTKKELWCPYCDPIQIFRMNKSGIEQRGGSRTKGVQYSIRAQPTLFDICPTSWQTHALPTLFQAKGGEVRKIHQTNSLLQVGQFVIAHSLFARTTAVSKARATAIFYSWRRIAIATVRLLLKATNLES